jgi:hypothetical protein
MTWQWIHSLPWSSIWDAFTGVGTVAMAVTTAVIIYQNWRQHQDAFRPICVLVPDHGTDAIARRGVVEHHEEPNNPTKYLNVLCSVKNIGTGPAVRLRLVFRSLINPAARPKIELPPIGANDSFAGPLRIPVFFHDQFNQTDYQLLPGDGWELWLIYEDVFGRVFNTRHCKNLQQPWTTTSVGPAPFSCLQALKHGATEN